MNIFGSRFRPINLTCDDPHKCLYLDPIYTIDPQEYSVKWDPYPFGLDPVCYWKDYEFSE